MKRVTVIKATVGAGLEEGYLAHVRLLWTRSAWRFIEGNFTPVLELP